MIRGWRSVQLPFGVARIGRLGALRAAALQATSLRSADNFRFGEVAEWLKALVSKTGRRATVSWVRIPPSPPANLLLSLRKTCFDVEFELVP